VSNFLTLLSNFLTLRGASGINKEASKSPGKKAEMGDVKLLVKSCCLTTKKGCLGTKFPGSPNGSRGKEITSFPFALRII
jgi:hypothetical protein